MVDEKKNEIEFEFPAVIDYDKSPKEAMEAGKYAWKHPILEGFLTGRFVQVDGKDVFKRYSSFREMALMYLEDRRKCDKSLKEEDYWRIKDFIETHLIGTHVRKVSLVCFGEKLTSKKAQGKLAELCLRPACVEDHLAAGEWTLEQECEFTIVSLGTSWRLFEPADTQIKDDEIHSGKLVTMVAVLKYESGRQLDLERYDKEWPGNVYFAAVPDGE